VITRQVTHLVRLVDDLLDISRISHGKVGLRPERVSLASVVESALEAVRPLLLSRRHALNVALPEAPVVLHGDRSASRRSSRTSFRTRRGTPSRRQHSRRGELRGRRRRRSCRRFRHRIPAAALPHIFTMFSQVAECPASNRADSGSA